MRINIHRHTPATGLTPPTRPAFRSLRGWAIGHLLEAHAIKECHEHGHIRDWTDPEAWHHAREHAAANPYPGTSPREAVAALDDVMRSIGDTCPECN
jgi:hypothetical protein